MDTIRYSTMDMDAIIGVLKNRGLIAFPTDTVFGLACIMDEEATAKVYEVKGRDFRKPLPMMCNGAQMIKEVAYVNEEAEKIIGAFMPGPLTLIFNKKECVSDHITQGLDTIGIRVPADDFILQLISELGSPIMVTSANLSGSASLIRYADVLKEFDGKIEGIVDGDARGEMASTIVDVCAEPKILREGPITLDMLKEVIR